MNAIDKRLSETVHYVLQLTKKCIRKIVHLLSANEEINSDPAALKYTF